jgi:hypothetical protein
MPDQKRPEDQQREHRMPGQDRGQQNTGNRDRESPQGTRSDQDRIDRDRQNQPGGNNPGKRDMSDQSTR